MRDVSGKAFQYEIPKNRGGWQRCKKVASLPTPDENGTVSNATDIGQASHGASPRPGRGSQAMSAWVA
jgi:hypothetical protein